MKNAIFNLLLNLNGTICRRAYLALYIVTLIILSGIFALLIVSVEGTFTTALLALSGFFFSTVLSSQIIPILLPSKAPENSI